MKKIAPAGTPPGTSSKDSLLERIKFAILDLPFQIPFAITYLDQLLGFGKYIRSTGLNKTPYFADRVQLYELLNQQLGDRPIDYLEFGVYTGASMRKWSAMNQNPASRFFGFDTFEGLPESWQFSTGVLEAGHFSTGGATPDIQDPRVRFIKGLFQDTLGSFLRGFQPQSQLVIHCDADLYSSTHYVLASMNEFMKPGTIVIFDEFGTVHHEFRAFMDYCASFRKKLLPLGCAGYCYEQAAFVVGE